MRSDAGSREKFGCVGFTDAAEAETLNSSGIIPRAACESDGTNVPPEPGNDGSGNHDGSNDDGEPDEDWEAHEGATGALRAASGNAASATFL
jgi:hypothetical protein